MFTCLKFYPLRVASSIKRSVSKVIRNLSLGEKKQQNSDLMNENPSVCKLKCTEIIKVYNGRNNTILDTKQTIK